VLWLLQIDVCAPVNPDTTTRIVRALQDLRPVFRDRPDLGVVLPDNHNLRLLKTLYLYTDAGKLDVLGELPEVCTYDELVGRCVTMEISGIRCLVVDIDTLMEAKRVAGRPKDLLTIHQLNAVKRERAQNPGLFE